MSDYNKSNEELSREITICRKKIDMLEKNQQEQDFLKDALLHRVKMEKIIGEISRDFVSTGFDQISNTINAALKKLGEFSEVDRTYVFKFSPDMESIDNTNEWCAGGIEPQIDNLKNIKVSDFPWWMDKLKRYEFIHIPYVDNLPVEAGAEKNILKAQGIISLLAVPMHYSGNLTGFIGFDSVRVRKTWVSEDIETLNIVGDIFASAFRHSDEDSRYRELMADNVWALQLAAIGELSANMAHEINSPINSIIMYSTLLKDENHDNPSIVEMAERTLRDARRIANIINALSSFAQTETREKTQVNLHQLIKETIAIVESQLDKDAIKTSLSIVDKVPDVLGNTKQLQHVFLNLINGARYTLNTKYPRADDNKALTITLQPVEGASKVQVIVNDSGEGLSSELRDKLMGTHYRVDEMKMGAGLGLFVSKSIVKEHGGNIFIESKMGEYTKVIVELPGMQGTHGKDTCSR